MNRIPWRCPNCFAMLKPLSDNGRRILRCPSGHSFDVARQGYVNLLLPNQRGAALPGDNAAMVRARTAFLDGGYYRIFSDAVNCLTAECLERAGIPSPVLVDAGCGEGYYTARLCQSLGGAKSDAACVGFDLSKHAVAHAARRAASDAASDSDANTGRLSDRLSFAVASLFSMPLADASCDGIINLFAPAAEAEFARILKPGGFLLMGVAAKEHLWGLKKAVYETPYQNEERRDRLAHFTLAEVRHIADTVTICGSAQIEALFGMTPYYWKTSASDRDKLASLDTLTTEIAIDLLLYRKNP